MAVLALLAVGAYVQAVTGFALGLVVLGAVTVAELAPVDVTAAMVSVATLFNVVLALHGRLHEVQWGDAGLMSVGMVPAVLAGVALLQHLDAGFAGMLEMALAVSILAGGVLLTLRPDPRPVAARGWTSLGAGALGGVLTGLFATGGPPVVYHLYRQPWRVSAVRSTLLAVFSFGCVARIGYLGWSGGLTAPVLGLSGAGIPVVVAATLVGKRFPPPMTDRAMRRTAFMLLVMLGIALLAK